VSYVKVWRWFFNDVEKEEAWLNEMASNGLNFVVPGKLGSPPYRFEKGTPGEWIYREEFLPTFASWKAGRRYLEFMAESGVDIVFASGWIAYFRKRAADGPFEVFSDLDSRIAHFRRIRVFLIVLTLLEVPWLATQGPLMFSSSGSRTLDALMLTSIVLSLVVVATGATLVARESRRIAALVARKWVFV
jgi:hypothetical protein